MNAIFAAAHEIEGVCRRAGFRFCFIGGLAVQRWGEPRMTQDVDLTVLSGFGTEAKFIDELLQHFSGRLSDARAFALQNRVLLLRASNGIALDVSLGAMPFEQRAIERSSLFEIGEMVALTTCSAEDLVVHKAFAGRDKDWADIAGIAVRQRGHLRERLIWDELLPLLALRDDLLSEARLLRVLEGKR